MAAEQRLVLGNVSGRWVAALVVLFLVIAYGVWFYYGSHAAADQSGRAQTISSSAPSATDDTTAAASHENKENTATPMIGLATGNDGSPRPHPAKS